jgi:hypothetical protein
MRALPRVDLVEGYIRVAVAAGQNLWAAHRHHTWRLPGNRHDPQELAALHG